MTDRSRSRRFAFGDRERASERALSEVAGAQCETVKSALEQAVLGQTNASLAQRRWSLASYLRWLRAADVRVADARPEDIEAWLASFGSSTFGARRHRLYAVKALHRALFAADWICRDPSENIRSAPESELERTVRSLDTKKRVVAQIVEEFGDPMRDLSARRDLVIFALAMILGRHVMNLLDRNWRALSEDLRSASREPHLSGLVATTIPPVVGLTIADLIAAIERQTTPIGEADIALPRLDAVARFEWLVAERPPLAALTRGSACRMLRNRLERSDAVPVMRPGKHRRQSFLLDWLKSPLHEVDLVLEIAVGAPSLAPPDVDDARA